MRRRHESSGGHADTRRGRASRSGGIYDAVDFPLFPIGPVLESYGGAPVVEGLGWKPYRCPFHGDRDASGSVNTEKQVFNCHAADCPKGNAVQVIMQAEGVSYTEAQQRAIAITGQVDSGPTSTDRRRGGSRGNRGGIRESAKVWRRPGR